MEYSEKEIKQAKKIVYSQIYSFRFLAMGKPFQFDGRTRTGNLSNYFFEEMKGEINRKEILSLQNRRREQKSGRVFINIYNQAGLEGCEIKVFTIDGDILFHRHLKVNTLEKTLQSVTFDALVDFVEWDRAR